LPVEGAVVLVAEHRLPPKRVMVVLGESRWPLVAAAVGLLGALGLAESAE